MANLDNAWMAENIKVYGACQCSLCGATAHLMKWGSYQCTDNEQHIGDGNTGIFTNLEMKGYKGYEKEWTKKNLKWFPWDESGSMEGLVIKPLGAEHYADVVYKQVMDSHKKYKKEMDSLTPLVMIDYQNDFITGDKPLTIDPKTIEKMMTIVKDQDPKFQYMHKYDGMGLKKKTPINADFAEPVKEVEKPKVFVSLLPAPKSRWGMKMKELLKTT